MAASRPTETESKRDSDRLKDKATSIALPAALAAMLGNNYTWTALSNHYIAITVKPANKTVIAKIEPSEDGTLSHQTMLLPQAASKIHALGNDYFVTLGGKNISFWDLTKIVQGQISRVTTLELPKDANIDPKLCIFNQANFIYLDKKKSRLELFDFESQSIKYSIPIDPDNTPIKLVAISNDTFAFAENRNIFNDVPTPVLSFVDTLSLDALKQLHLNQSWSLYPNCFTSPNGELFVLRVKERMKETTKEGKIVEKTEDRIFIYRNIKDFDIEMLAQLSNLSMESPTPLWQPDNTLAYFDKENGLCFFNPSDLSVRQLGTPYPQGTSRMLMLPNGVIELVSPQMLSTIIPGHIQTIESAVSSFIHQALFDHKQPELPTVMVDMIQSYDLPSEHYATFKATFSAPSAIPKALGDEMVKLYEAYRKKLQNLDVDTNPSSKKYIIVSNTMLALKGLAKHIEKNPGKPLHRCIGEFLTGPGRVTSKSFQQDILDLLDKLGAAKLSAVEPQISVRPPGKSGGK
jgi:hypothetical protein